MEMRRNWKVSMVCMLVIALFTPVVNAGILCGQDFEFIQSEPGPVDIACATGSVHVFDGTANLVEGGVVTDLVGYAGATINIYGGTILGGDYGLNFGSAVTVTLYATSADVDLATVTDKQAVTGPDIDMLEITDSYIKNIGTSQAGGPVYFDLVGTYQDANATPFVIPCVLEHNAKIDLNLPQPAPEIFVTPALLTWDLGDVPIGESAMQLVVIYNQGNADLIVDSVTVSGSSDFAITAGPATPLVIPANSSIGADFEVTYTPSSEGLASAVVTVVSNDDDEPQVDVTFIGAGVVVDVPPQQQIQDILDYFDECVANGTLIGYGPGNSPSKRLEALRNMIESASDLINAGDLAQAIEQLESIDKKTDGQAKPQDFVMGDPVSTLNTMINDLIADLAS